MQFRSIQVFLVFLECSFILPEECYSGLVDFIITCRGENYSGPLRIELKDTNTLVLDDTIEDVSYELNGRKDLVHFRVNLNKVKRCWEVKPKFIFYSTCPKPLDFDRYGAFIALEAPRRFIVPDKKLLYKVEIKLDGAGDIENLQQGRHLELSQGDYGIAEFI